MSVARAPPAALPAVELPAELAELRSVAQAKAAVATWISVASGNAPARAPAPY